MTNNPSSNAVLSGLASNLADELAQMVVQEHKLLQTELKQITELTDDAVRELSRITIQLKGSTENIMRSRMDDDKQSLTSLRDGLTQLSDQVDVSTCETVRTLQFGDILKQLTDHVLSRAVSMDALFTSLSNEVEMIKRHLEKSDENVNAADRMTQRISSMSEKIQSYKSSLPKSSPVKQKNLKAGNVELF
jgi:methyl-accepting chemotaxis protein